jgi:hypothetical protein
MGTNLKAFLCLLARVLTTSFLAAMPEFVRAQPVNCNTRHTSMTGSTSNCLANNSHERSETWEMWFAVACSQGGWQSQDTGHQSRTQSAYGGCDCPGDIFGPSDGGFLGGTHRMVINYTNYDPTTCSIAFQGTQNTDFGDTGCQSSLCCGQEGICTGVGEWNGTYCACTLSPILIDLGNGGFNLTGPEEGVRFDLDRNGTAERRAWTRAGSRIAFLVLDRNENGRIDDGGELFGSGTDQPLIEGVNGFNALSVFDTNGDRVITSADPIFGSLKLWIDLNHDGISQPDELEPLAPSPIQSISLNYREARRRDSHGNVFRYRARVEARTPVVGEWAWDVFLMGVP